MRIFIKFYIKNPGERKRIASEGLREALAKHTYEHRIRKLLEIVDKGILK